MVRNVQETVDVIVVGSGGTGLIAALSAAVHGADVLLLESEEGIGGTTLFSGGQIWVPNNHYMTRVGVSRSQFPCLGTIEKPPYYALEVFTSSVGTKGGPLTNANWQVIREDESVIEGLYAVGNCSAAIIGPITIAPAATLGSGMTAGYIAGKHAAERI